MRLGLLVVAVAVVTACTAAAEPEASTTTAAPAPTTTEAPATTTTTTPPTTTTVPATTVPEVAERQFGFVEPFTMALSPDWFRDEASTQQTLFILSPSGNGLVFAVTDRATVEEWREYLTTNPGLIATTPTDAEVGGAAGFTTDVVLSADATNAGCMGADPCVSLVSDPPGWVVYPGYANRLWVVDVDGRAVLVAAESVQASFDGYVAEVEEILDTLTWTES